LSPKQINLTQTLPPARQASKLPAHPQAPCQAPLPVLAPFTLVSACAVYRRSKQGGSDHGKSARSSLSPKIHQKSKNQQCLPDSRWSTWWRTCTMAAVTSGEPYTVHPGPPTLDPRTFGS